MDRPQKKDFEKMFFRKKKLQKKMGGGPSTSSKTQAIVSKLIPQVRDEIWKKYLKKNDLKLLIFLP